MQIPLKHGVKYNKMLTALTVLTSVAVLACIGFGYPALPFAAGMYATLLFYDIKRIISALLPIAFFALNFFLSGIYSLEGISYVIVGLILYFLFRRGASKAEVAFWLSLVVMLLSACSLILFAFDSMNAVGISAIKDFYLGLYDEGKAVFADFIASASKNLDGDHELAYNVYEAENLYNRLIFAIVPGSMITAFALSGITLKIFTCEIKKYSGFESVIDAWSFRTPNLVAWFYVVISVLGLFVTSDGGVFVSALTVLSTVFSFVFAYLGISFVYSLLRYNGRTALFSIFAIIMVFLLTSSIAVRIFSYIGVFINVVTNKALRNHTK